MSDSKLSLWAAHGFFLAFGAGGILYYLVKILPWKYTGSPEDLPTMLQSLALMNCLLFVALLAFISATAIDLRQKLKGRDEDTSNG